MKPIRRKPPHGTVIRIPLPNGEHAYGLLLWESHMWLYSFVTSIPAFGESFFPLNERKYPAHIFRLPSDCVDCARLPIALESHELAAKFYSDLSDGFGASVGVKTKYGLYTDNGWREITEDEIERGAYYEKEILDYTDMRSFIAKHRSEMWVKEVPPEFVDKRKQKVPKPEPGPVEFRIILVQADLATDDPEPDIQDPLEAALDEAEAGSVTDTGTNPDGTFDIGVECPRSARAKTLRIIRRTLVELKCPASTVIEEAGDPIKTHALYKAISEKSAKRGKR